MCSVLGIFGLQQDDDPTALRREALERSSRQRHRGPDWSGVYMDDGAILVHERLAIVDVEGGAQPMRSADRALVLAVNGEIYNHRQLRSELTHFYQFSTGSDCEVINALYWRERSGSFLSQLSAAATLASSRATTEDPGASMRQRRASLCRGHSCRKHSIARFMHSS
jgi:asparagine synthase (glutamine-hydrolysing)